MVFACVFVKYKLNQGNMLQTNTVEEDYHRVTSFGPYIYSFWEQRRVIVVVLAMEFLVYSHCINIF